MFLTNAPLLERYKFQSFYEVIHLFSTNILHNQNSAHEFRTKLFTKSLDIFFAILLNYWYICDELLLRYYFRNKL